MAKKKANNEGSISKRSDGRYMGRYTVNGKRRAVYGETYEAVRVPLFPKAWEDLMKYREKQREMLSENGITMTTATPVFSTPTGLVYEPRTYEDLFKRTIKEAKISDINFHALRHTFATRALEAGMDIKVLSSILGHAQASTTLNFYAHALPNHKRESMDKMEAYYEKTLASE